MSLKTNYTLGNFEKQNQELRSVHYTLFTDKINVLHYYMKEQHYSASFLVRERSSYFCI